MEDKESNKILIFIGIILLISILFEGTLLGIAFFGADKVECNLIWCTFTTERTNINDTIIVQSHKSCFYNGYEIDCNDSRLDLPIIITDGNFDRKPIFKHDNNWEDVLE